jgi:thiamine-monophosphate kinase
LEEKFIKLFKSKYIGDDGAVIKCKGKKVIASDSFFEGTHFKKEWLSYEEIGYKASIVNISDLVVMNAKPKYAILNVAYSNEKFSDLKDLANGLIKASKEYGYEIIGGDTIKSDKLAISITLIGDVKKEITRRAKVGEFVAFTGELGESLKDLKRLLKGEKIKKTSKFKRVKLRDKFFYKASKFITSACDISDGLYKELERISRISNVDYKFLKRFSKDIGCSGEEYEILFTFNKKHKKAIEKIAKITRTKITIFAVTKRGRFKSLCKNWH